MKEYMFNNYYISYKCEKNKEKQHVAWSLIITILVVNQCECRKLAEALCGFNSYYISCK